jgi:adenylate kinase family enzyme
MGASGAGSTRLASALASRLGFKHLDSDEYLWDSTDIPFSHKRDPTIRDGMMICDMNAVQDCIVSGCVMKWGG